MDHLERLLKEPLLWVGAVIVAVPVLTPSVLSKARESLYFSSERTQAQVSSLDEIPPAQFPPDDRVASEIAIFNTETASSAKSNRSADPEAKIGLFAKNAEGGQSSDESSGSTAEPPFPKSNGVASESEFSWLGDDSESLPTPKTKSVAKQPTDRFAESETGTDSFDFLFGEDDAESSRPQSKQESQLKSENNRKLTDDSSLPSHEPVPRSLQPQLDATASDETENEGTSNWLFPDATTDDSIGKSSDDFSGKTEIPQMDPGSLIAPLSERSQLPSPPPMSKPDQDRVGTMDSGYDDNGYYMALDTGYDWWSAPSLNPLWADRFTKPTGLDAVVFSAMQNAPTVRMINAQPQLAQTLVTEADARFDWSTFVDASWSDVDRAVVSLLDTGTAGGRFLQQQLIVEGGLKKQTRSGGHLRVGQALQRTDNNSDFISPPDQATTQLLLDYRQPLLKGAGRHVNSSQIMLAQFGMEVSQEDSQVQLQQFLVDVVAQYWKLYEARALLVQKLKSAQRAEQLLQHLSQLPSTESQQRLLLRVQAAVTTRQTELIRVQNQAMAAQEALLTLTHGAGMADLDSIELVPIEAPATFAVPQSMQAVTEMALQNRAEIRMALTEIKASAVRQQLALNHLKPQLDAVISTFLSGVAENKNVGNASNDAFSNNPSYAVGLSFQLPIGRRASNARLHREELESRRLNDQLQQILGNVRLDARLAYRDVQSHAAEYEQFRVAMKQAAKELQSIESQSDHVLLDPQRSSLFVDDLLQSQARLAFTEQRMLASQTELSIALVRLKRATGQLIQTSSPYDSSVPQVQQASYEATVEQWDAPATPTEAVLHDLSDDRIGSPNQVSEFTPLPPMNGAGAAPPASANHSARRLPQQEDREHRDQSEATRYR